MIVSATTHAEPRLLETDITYRVDFWHPSDRNWNLDAYVVTDAADAREVLTWIVENLTEGCTFELYVEVDAPPVDSAVAPRRSGLIRIAGENPNLGVTVPMGEFVPDARNKRESEASRPRQSL
jgi:hypothetical protein